MPSKIADLKIWQFCLNKTIMMYCSENRKKNIRDIFRIMSNSYDEAFLKNLLTDFNYFCKKNSLIGIRCLTES